MKESYYNIENKRNESTEVQTLGVIRIQLSMFWASIAA